MPKIDPSMNSVYCRKNSDCKYLLCGKSLFPDSTKQGTNIPHRNIWITLVLYKSTSSNSKKF